MIEIFQHPSSCLNDNTIDSIRLCSHEAETLKHLHPDQLDLIRKNKWFKALIPKTYGGLGLTLPQLLQLEEGLSYADGSVGWVVTLCSGAGWFIGFVNPNMAQELFSPDNVCIAGSGGVTGTAEQTEGGYIIDGVWKYASGALHATAFTANCYVTRGGKPVVCPDGSQKISTFIFKKDEVTISDTWRAMGMIATGSHSFEVKNLQLRSDRCFHIGTRGAMIGEPVYRYPFLQLAESTLAANMSGMAIRFVELAASTVRNRPADEHIVGSAITLLNESRKLFFNEVNASWQLLILESGISTDTICRVSERSQVLVKTCREVVSDLYPRCGLAAAFTDNEINRVWRNFNTAGQHSLFTFRKSSGG